MKKIRNIILLIILVGSGMPIRDYFVAAIIKNAPNSNYSQISKALKSSPDISIWGSSTAYVNFDAKTITNDLQRNCHNFGLSGAFFNQLDHLYSFSKRNQDKTIVWIINPYEFKEDVTSKLKKEAFFTPFNHEMGKSTDKYFAWHQIYNLNAQHWALVFKSNNFNEFNEYGNKLMTKPFKAINGYHEDENPFNFSKNKIAILNQRIDEISQKNKLVIVLPPHLGNALFMPFKQKLNCQVIDYSNAMKDKADFHDYIHLNERSAIKISVKLAIDLRKLLK